MHDQKRYVLINKEYKDLKRILERGDIYKLLISNINEAQQIITEASECFFLSHWVDMIDYVFIKKVLNTR
jgi:hypothetical protein